MPDSFVFYRSFLETLDMIPDVADRHRLCDAIIEYGLEGNEADLPYPLNIALHQMVASIKGAQTRREINRANGQKGGAPKGNRNAVRKSTETTNGQPTNNRKTIDFNLNENAKGDVDENISLLQGRTGASEGAAPDAQPSSSPDLPEDFESWASEETDYNGGRCRNYWSKGGGLRIWVISERQTNTP